MKNTIKLLFTIVMLMALSNVQAQSHTFATGWCKLAKSGGVKGESASLECQACNAKDKKEIAAKNVENKRRDDEIAAKVRAEREAYENARLEKLRLAQQEAKRIKDEQAANEAMMKRYKEIAEKGIIKSNANGERIETDLIVDKIVPFLDNIRKIYGFKIDNNEVLTIPSLGKISSFSRLKGTNYFELVEYISDRQWSTSIIDQFGNKKIIDGESKFLYIPNNFQLNNNNTICVYVPKGSPKRTEKDYYYSTFHNMLFNSPDSGLAWLESHQYKSGFKLQWHYYFIYYVKKLILDPKLNLMENSTGYIFVQID